MTISEIRKAAIAPAMALLPGSMNSPAAELMLLAIGLQESGFRSRHQQGGPAHGYWQFELAGVRCVLQHPKSQAPLLALCKARKLAASAPEIYRALEFDDILAAGVARLLLWTDPAPLPAPGDIEASWRYYQRCWRPGRPRYDHWNDLYPQAMAAMS